MSIPISVAVIGSGIGASSTCYFLKKLLGENVIIDVYEAESTIGGRTLPFLVDKRNVELGASIAFDGNKYVKNWAEEFQLSILPNHIDNLGLWDGNSFVFKESSSSSLTQLDLFKRYGFDLMRIRSEVIVAAANFSRIYDAQTKGISFEHPQDLWKHLNLYDYTQRSLNSSLKRKLSSNSKLSTELISAINRINYNQSNELNSLAGYVSMIPTLSGKVFSTKEGWTAIYKHSCLYSSAPHKNIFLQNTRKLSLSTPITKIIINNKNQTLNNSSSSEESIAVNNKATKLTDTSKSFEYELESNGYKQGRYDAVVLACPLHSDSITLDVVDNSIVNIISKVSDGDSDATVSDSQSTGNTTGTTTGNTTGNTAASLLPVRRGEYQPVVATFVRGSLNQSYFNFNKERPTEDIPVIPSTSSSPPSLPSTNSSSSSSSSDDWVTILWKYMTNSPPIPDVFPTSILITEGAENKESFSSIRRLWMDEDGNGIYKVFSSKPLNVETMHQLFSPSSSIITTKVWQAAYPKFHSPEELPSFRPVPNRTIYYVNALEAAVSAMEVSAIAGRNVALLIKKDFEN